jgi:transcriptional regulator with XRE-family HTH domain
MYSLEPTPYETGLKIAQRHRALRKRLNISQKEMAERSGVSLGSLKRFERSGKISLESLLKLMHFLGRLSDFDKILEEKVTPEDIERLFTNK